MNVNNMKLRIFPFRIINVICDDISNHGADLVILEYSSPAGLNK